MREEDKPCRVWGLRRPGSSLEARGAWELVAQALPRKELNVSSDMSGEIQVKAQW